MTRCNDILSCVLLTVVGGIISKYRSHFKIACDKSRSGVEIFSNDFKVTSKYLYERLLDVKILQASSILVPSRCPRHIIIIIIIYAFFKPVSGLSPRQVPMTMFDDVSKSLNPQRLRFSLTISPRLVFMISQGHLNL